MNSKSLALLLLCLAAACSSEADPKTAAGKSAAARSAATGAQSDLDPPEFGSYQLLAEQPEDPLACKFGWPVPTELEVTEENLQRGRRFSARYRIRLEPAAEGEELILRKDRYRMLSIEGIAADDPRFPAAAQQQAKLTVFPARRISKAGRYLGIADFSAFLESVETALRGVYGATDPRVARTLEMMRAPRMRPVLEQRAGDEWRAWAEIWLDFDLPAGIRRERSGSHAMGPQTLRSKDLLHCLGLVEAPPAHLRLQFESVCDNQDGQLESLFKSILSQAPPKLRAQARSLPAAAAMTSVLEVVLDPATTRPHEILMRRRIELGIPGMPESQRREVRRYRFSW